MSDTRLALCLLHVLFWLAFLLVRAVVSRVGPAAPQAGDQRNVEVAEFATLAVVAHGIAFGLMYSGVSSYVMQPEAPEGGPPQLIAAACIVLAGSLLSCWALLTLRSWRLKAQIDPGHELTTDGPFRLMRHPIYMSFNLLSLGTALWIPSPYLWLSFLLIVLVGDVRARMEERVLARSFGDTYRNYCTHTRRFVPGIY